MVPEVYRTGCDGVDAIVILVGIRSTNDTGVGVSLMVPPLGDFVLWKKGPLAPAGQSRRQGEASDIHQVDNRIVAPK